MTLTEFLKKMAESCPPWLSNFTPDTRFDAKQFFASRVVFYPGSGHDGHAVKAFGSAHAAHCFVYVDYDLPQSSIEAALDHPLEHFRGYRTIVRRSLTQRDLLPNNWHPHASSAAPPSQRPQIVPYGFLEVLERETGFGPEHGAERLAILFLGADGHATYDALFCQANQVPPFAILMQDHGFGGNYSPFGRGGIMEQIANNMDRKPDFLLVADNTNAWDGYQLISDVEGELGSQHSRRLFSRSSTHSR